MDDEPQTVPGLSADPEPAPSKSVQKRLAVQRGKPMPTFEAPAHVNAAPPPVAFAGRTYATWRLVKPFDLYRSASVVQLEAGQELSEQHWDIADLQRRGAELERLP